MAAGERTEAATPRRLQELRAQGRIPRSGDLTAAVALLTGFGALQAFGGSGASWLSWYLQRQLTELPQNELTEARVAELALGAGVIMLGVMAPLALLPLAGAVASAGQGGIVLSGHVVDAERINPLAGLRRLFSGRSLFEALKAAAKAGILGVVLVRVYSDSLPELLSLGTTSMGSAAVRLAETFTHAGLIAGAALLALGVLDFAYQRWEFLRSARMTREDLRQELRETEGNPQLRARIRQIQRKLATGRMMHRVPTADVVVVNPTHLAIALVYRGTEMAAPQVVAKGAGVIAERIKEVARAHGVPVVENRPLAQALFRSVDIGQQIPEVLFQAVAQVLAYVYGLRQPAGGGAAGGSPR